jgi:hypothetical protein
MILQKTITGPSLEPPHLISTVAFLNSVPLPLRPTIFPVRLLERMKCHGEEKEHAGGCHEIQALLPEPDRRALLPRSRDSEAPGAPPMRPASEREWWGERKGRVVTRAALPGSRPLIEWILVRSHSPAPSLQRQEEIVPATLLVELPGQF